MSFLRRAWSLSIKEFIHLRNDWWLPAFMLVGGAMELLLVGWATSRPIANLPMMVLDRDRSSASRQFVQEVINTGTLRFSSAVEGIDEIRQAMDKGDVNAAIVIPAGFSQQLLQPSQPATISVWLNGAESLPATTVKRAVQGVVDRWNDRIAIEQIGLPEEDLSGFFPSLRVWFNEALSEAFYTVPAELGLMLEFTVLLFAALSISRERELGTLEQLLVMPYSSFEIIVGKSLPVILIGMADFALMLSMVNLIFGVPVRGSLLLLFILGLVYVLVELSKGLMISVLARTQQQAFLLILMVGMADFMFTGYAAPVESMPPILQSFANLVPAHHWLTILRGILLKSSGLDVLWPQVTALLILGAVIGAVSLRYVRRALN